MARLARVEIFAPDEIAICHLCARTVRKCYLLGDDPNSGKNYDHRKDWIEKDIKRLAGLFGIDLLGYAILSNHFHLILRSRPDVVATWEDREVARRWWTLCPKRKTAAGQPEEPSESEIRMIADNPQKVAAIRLRLSDISWWMRLLCQKVAQRANREDQEVGKFWQARYRSVRILDESALLACAAYVDLNPIRAALAETLETSDFTSVQKRICALQSNHGIAGHDRKKRGQRPVGKRIRDGVQTSDGGLRPDANLAPLAIDEARDPIGPCASETGLRASDKGFLPIPLASYLELLDWTARQLRKGKRGATPRGARPVFERLGISGEVWCELVREFGRLFAVVAGKPEAIDARRSRDGKHRYRARIRARELFAA